MRCKLFRPGYIPCRRGCCTGLRRSTMPYEFMPLPEVGDKGIACGRDGKEVCECEVTKVRTAPVFDHTNLLTIKVPNDMLMKARFYRAKKEAVL